MLKSTLIALCIACSASAVAVERSSLIVLPEERSQGINRARDPFLSLIDQAEKEILMSAFKLQKNKLPQKDLLDALEAAVKRGVRVYVIGEDRLTNVEKVSAPEEQKGGLKAYMDRGVNVVKLQKYAQYHTKYVVIDGKLALLGTTNFDKDFEGHNGSKRSARDFSLKVSDPAVIEELTNAFWSDYHQKDDFKSTLSSLLWGPEGQREKLIAMIEKAENTIRIYQQSIQDDQIVDTLIRSMKNGVKVELLMSPFPHGLGNPDYNIDQQRKLVQAGAKVYLTKDLNIHAKVMIIDDQLMYLGSTNFYAPAIDGNRNVGLLSKDSGLLEQILDLFEKDKINSVVIRKKPSR